MDRHNGFTSLGFIEQSTDFEAARLAQMQQFKHRGNGVPTIHDIFHEQHILVTNICLQVHGDAHRAA